MQKCVLQGCYKLQQVCLALPLQYRLGCFTELRHCSVIVLTSAVNYAFLKGFFFLFWHNKKDSSVDTLIII